METTNKNDVKQLQQRIICITGGIVPPQKTKNNFLDIMSIRMGKKHPLYQESLQMVASPQKQLELFFASDRNKLKKDFNRFCHMVLKGYFEQKQEKSTFCQYFKELELCSQKSSGLLDFSFLKKNFTRLRDMEKEICDNVLNQTTKAAPYAYRQLLTAWLMFPELIFFPEKINNILNLFEEKVLHL